jgi:hypothetical protein
VSADRGVNATQGGTGPAPWPRHQQFGLVYHGLCSIKARREGMQQRGAMQLQARAAAPRAGLQLHGGRWMRQPCSGDRERHGLQ